MAKGVEALTGFIEAGAADKVMVSAAV